MPDNVNVLQETIVSFPIDRYILEQIKLAKMKEIIPRINIGVNLSDEIENLISIWGQLYYLNLYDTKYELNRASLYFTEGLKERYSLKLITDELYRMLKLNLDGGYTGAISYLCEITKEIHMNKFVSSYLACKIYSKDYKKQNKIAEEYLLKYKNHLPVEFLSLYSLTTHIREILACDIIKCLEKRPMEMANMVLKDDKLYKKLAEDILNLEIKIVKHKKNDINFVFPKDMPEEKIALTNKWYGGYRNTTLKAYRCANKYCGGLDIEFEKFEHKPKVKEDDDDIFLPPLFEKDREWMARMHCRCCNWRFYIALEGKDNAYSIGLDELNNEWLEKTRLWLSRHKHLNRIPLVPIKRWPFCR